MLLLTDAQWDSWLDANSAAYAVRVITTRRDARDQSETEHVGRRPNEMHGSRPGGLAVTPDT